MNTSVRCVTDTDTTDTVLSAVTDTMDTAHSDTTDTAATTDTTATANSVITTVSDREDTPVLVPISACPSDPGPWKAVGVIGQMDPAGLAHWRKGMADVDAETALADMAQWRMDLSDVGLSDISMEEDLGRGPVVLDVERGEEGRKEDAAAEKMTVRKTKAPKLLLLKGL